MPIEQSLPLLPRLILPKSCLTRRADLNGFRSFALSPANSRLLANRDPVASAQCSNHRWYGNASLNQPNRLDCGGARLSGNRGATRADNLSSMYVRIFLMTTGSSMQAMTFCLPCWRLGGHLPEITLLFPISNHWGTMPVSVRFRSSD